MPARKILAVATAAPLLLGVAAADAAPKKPAPKKPVCNLIKDAKGDATGTGSPATGPNDPNLDILSADVATNASTLTAVFRLSAFGSAEDSSPLGRTYTFSFAVGTQTVSVRAVVSQAGNVWAQGNGTGTVDTAKKEVRVHVPLAKLTSPVKPNAKLVNLKATSFRWIGGAANVSLGQVDVAESTATYVAGWPSCVKVGA